MKISGQYLEDQFRSAEQVEIREGDGGHLFAGIVSELDRSRLDNGFSISFGSDRESLQTVIDVIGLDSFTSGEAPSYQICQAICYDGGGCTGFVGKALPALSELSLVDAVEVLQADDWVVENREQYPYIRASGDEITSSLVLSTRSGELDDRGLSMIDASVPGFVISASFRYAPDFTVDESEMFSDGALPYFLKDHTEAYGDPGYGVIEIAKEVRERLDPLRMPGVSYLLAYGRFRTAYIVGNINGVVVPLGNRFSVEDGGLTAVPSRYDDLTD